MIDLLHYSTFNNKDEFIEKITDQYSVAVQQGAYMDIDDRTRWVSQTIAQRSDDIWSVDYDDQNYTLKLNGQAIRIRELHTALPRPEGKLLIDATSLNYPELQYLFYWLEQINCPFDLIYVEPEKYISSDVEFGLKDNFQLSEDGPGLSQLPPFLGGTQSEVINVLSIGFEGHRVMGLLNNDEFTDPGLDFINLVVGVPAFKAGFERTSLKANSSALEIITKSAKKEVHFASANNPYAVLSYLKKVSKGSISQSINLIPFGTKPTAVGMAWFAVKNKDDTIVTYDHVKKLSGRSKGVGKVHFARFGTT